jgi:hypothetical protein
MIENTRVDARTHFKGPGDDDGRFPVPAEIYLG